MNRKNRFTVDPEDLVGKPTIKETLNKLIPFMVRQAHHERNQQLTVRPELVEGLNQSFLKGTRISVELILDRVTDAWVTEDILSAYPHLSRPLLRDINDEPA